MAIAPELVLNNNVEVKGKEDVVMSCTAHSFSFHCNLNFRKQLLVDGEPVNPDSNDFGTTGTHVSIDFGNPDEVASTLAEHPYLQGLIESLVPLMGAEYQ